MVRLELKALDIRSPSPVLDARMHNSRLLQLTVGVTINQFSGISSYGSVPRHRKHVFQPVTWRAAGEIFGDMFVAE